MSVDPAKHLGPFTLLEENTEDSYERCEKCGNSVIRPKGAARDCEELQDAAPERNFSGKNLLTDSLGPPLTLDKNSQIPFHNPVETSQFTKTSRARDRAQG